MPKSHNAARILHGPMTGKVHHGEHDMWNTRISTNTTSANLENQKNVTMTRIYCHIIRGNSNQSKILATRDRNINNQTMFNERTKVNRARLVLYVSIQNNEVSQCKVSMSL